MDDFGRSPAQTTHTATPPKRDLGAPLMGRALVVSVVAGLAGAGGWYALTLATNMEIGYAAIGVGLLVGYATLWAAKKGGVATAVLASAVTLLAIAGGKYMATQAIAEHALRKVIAPQYTEAVSFAKSAYSAETDDDKRQILAALIVEDGQEPRPEVVQQTAIDDYDHSIRPIFEPLATGKVSKDEWLKSRVSENLDSVTMNVFTDAKEIFFTILWLALGIGAAWRLASVE